MKKHLFIVASTMAGAIACHAQSLLMLSPKVGTAIDAAEKKQYGLFPYYSSKEFITAGFYLLADSSIQLRTVLVNDSNAKRTVSQQEFAFMQSVIDGGGRKPEHKKQSDTTKVAGSKGFYLSMGAGYGMSSANSASAYENSHTTSGSQTVYEYKLKKGSGSYGRGIQLGLTAGYMLSKNIGIELNGSYLIGAKITSTEKNTSGSYTQSNTDSYRAMVFRITPAVKLAIPVGKGSFYMRTGLVIAIRPKLINTFNNTDSGFGVPNTNEGEAVYTGGTALGYTAGMGFNFNLSKTLSVYTEFGFIAQSWAPKKAVLTKYTFNGVDRLNTMTTSDKEIEFVDSYSSSSSTPYDPNSPSRSLKMYVPLSSVGINAGLHFKFGK
jgi:hypothetical protein